MAHFKKYWSKSLQGDVEVLLQEKFIERYNHLHTAAATAQSRPQTKRLPRVQGLLRRHLDTDSDNGSDSEDDEDAGGDLNSPWKGEFRRYLDTVEAVPPNMNIVEWWGLNAHRYPTWASLARDYLSVMASSVSSERAFSELDKEDIIDVDMDSGEIFEDAEGFSWDMLAQAEPEPTSGRGEGSGFNFDKPELFKAEPKPGLAGRAGPAQH
ncbi:hypothetical protein M413DRAFT_18815 [Hebeloma cylindrosporum]|uniref:HAT C-terminal dimerisation domain-containing protein n=1 Tax=Hebeloma cylindrosporum TaxID=76867 RepID=A0A0C3BZE8_HEBCY|nr:hypothetical protein M413DRAFT_18815 [Hebeloma cylindrosporum h7]